MNPRDLELIKQVPDAFGHDARRYVPRINQGDVITGLKWNNEPDYFLDTWEGFSQVLQNLDPKRLQTEIFIPMKEDVFGPKGYVKRKYKDAVRFERISFTFSGTTVFGEIFLLIFTANFFNFFGFHIVYFLFHFIYKLKTFL